MKLYKIIATWFGTGLLKPASGTWGTLGGLPLCLGVTYWCGQLGIILGAFILFSIGFWAAHCYETETGEHDSSHIVIDEVAGMLLACLPLLYLFNIKSILVCFILFRVFDALKIGLVGWCDKNISGAFGVMIDDAVAGLLTSITVFGVLLWMS